MANYTADTLRSILKGNLHNDTTYSDPGDLNTYLTLAQQKIVALAPHILGVKTADITLVSGTREYSLATDFFQMYGMYFPAQNRQLYPIPWQDYIDEIERYNTRPAGPPREFCVFGYDDGTPKVWRVRLNPEPDAAGTVTYSYYWMPADISGTAVVPLSQIGFGGALTWCATWLARERNDPEGALQAQASFDREMRLIYEYTPQPEYTPVVGPRLRFRGSTLRLPSTYPDV